MTDSSNSYDILPEKIDLSKQQLLWEDLILPLGFRPNIERSFIQPIQSNTELYDYSAIIFGPPGTGKTSLLKAIAKQLDWELFIIGPQHFVKKPIEQSMASCIEDIRKYLQKKSDSIKQKGKHGTDNIPAKIIFAFDEIDELVISRENEGDRQSRFSTTIMLPLFQELHDLAKEHRFIFFALTNHIERFDSAITRRDRFDLILPLGPPDRRARYLLFEMFLDDLIKQHHENSNITIRTKFNKRFTSDASSIITTLDLDVVSRASARMTLNDIKAICTRVVEQQLAYDNTQSGEFLNLETRYFIDWINKLRNSSSTHEIEKFYKDRQKFARSSTVYPKSHTLQEQVEHEFNSLHVKNNLPSLRKEWKVNQAKTLEFSLRNLTGLGIFEGQINVRAIINDTPLATMDGVVNDFLNPGESSEQFSFTITPTKPGKLRIIFTINGEIDLRGIEQVMERGQSKLGGNVILKREVKIDSNQPAI